MRRPLWRSSCLTPALPLPKQGLVWDTRRGNMMQLFQRVTYLVPRPMILHHCSTAAKNPFPLTGASAQHPCIPLTASPRITLTLGRATADSWTLQSITWWVWGPVTTLCSCQVSMPSIRPFPLHDLSGVSPTAACKPAAAALFHTKTNGCCAGSTTSPQPIIMGHSNQKLHFRFVPFELYQFCPQSSGVYFSFLSLLVQRFVVRFLSPSRLYDNST